MNKDKVYGWEVGISPDIASITYTEVYKDDVDRLSGGWQYCGDAEYYRFFLTEVEAKQGLKEYLNKQTERNNEIIATICKE